MAVTGPDVVGPQPPVAGVVLLGRRRAGGDRDAVDVHLLLTGLLGHHDVVPLAVVDGLGRVDGGRGTDPHAVAQTAVGQQVEVAVVVRAGLTGRVAEADDPAAVGVGGADPRLEREGGRVGVLLGADHAVVVAVEVDRGATRIGRRGRPAPHGAARGGPRVQRHAVDRAGAARLVESQVEIGVGVPHRGAVRIGGHGGPARGPTAGQEVGPDLLLGELAAVDGDVVDGAVEVGRRGLRRPTTEGVTTDAPVAGERLSTGGGGVGTDQLAVDVELDAGRAELADGLVPLAVVVGGRRRHGSGAAVVHAEAQLTAVGHVDVTVVAGARSGRRLAEPDDLAARRGRRLEPRLDGELLRSVDRCPLGRGRSGAAGEGGRRVGVADQGTDHATGGVRVEGQVVGADLVVADRAARLPEAPVLDRRVREDRGTVRAGGRSAVRNGAGDGGADEAVAEGVANPDPVGLSRSRGRGCVHCGEHRAVPPRRRRVGAGGHDRRGVDGRSTEDLVGQLGVVTVPDRLPRDAQRPGRDRHQGRGELGVALEQVLVGRDRLDGEPGQALLVGAVDPGELAAEHDVLAVALHRPGGLGLTGERSDGQRRQPVQLLGAGAAVELAADVHRSGGVRVDRLGLTALEGPRAGLGMSTHRRAVVGVADVVEDVADRGGVVVVPSATVDPYQLTGGGVGCERRLQVPAGGRVVVDQVGEAGPEDLVAVGGQAPDRGVRTPVLDDLVGRERDECPGRGIERGQTAGRNAVHVVEVTADDNLALAGRDDHCPDLEVGHGRPRAECTGGGVDGRQPGSALVADDGERTTDVEGVAREGEAVDVGVDVGVEGPERPGGGVQGGHPIAGRAVDLGEVTGDVDRAAVGRSFEGPPLGVERRRPRGDQVPGGDVVRQDVGSRCLVRSRCGSGRPGRGERPRRVDGVADDQLVPHHTVDLDGGEAVSRDGLRLRGIDRSGVGSGHTDTQGDRRDRRRHQGDNCTGDAADPPTGGRLGGD